MSAVQRGPAEGAAMAKPDLSKVKFSCPVRGQNAWAKQMAKMDCIATADCGNVPMNTSND